MAKKYPNPGAFEQALKARVKRRARETGVGFNRVLQIVLFERFLARVYDALGDAVAIFARATGILGRTLRRDAARR